MRACLGVQQQHICSRRAGSKERKERLESHLLLLAHSSLLSVCEREGALWSGSLWSRHDPQSSMAVLAPGRGKGM